MYDPHPTLTYEWDPLESANGLKRAPSRMTGKGRSYDLLAHPSDPRSAAAIVDARSGDANRSSTIQKDSVPGQEIWFYEDHKGRTFTFWRFMLQIPLSEVCVTVAAGKVGTALTRCFSYRMRCR